jgi:hypothetical protein
MKRGLLTVITLVAACSGSDPSQIYTNKADGYSVGQPAGWSTSEDRGSVRFSPRSGKQTIVVRSALRPAEIIEGKPATNDDVIDATTKVLQRMSRRHKLADPTRIENAELPGVRFTLTYRPPSTRTPYQRTHVLLFGQRRLFHLIQTSPQGEKLDEHAMKEMVSTLTEEG